MPRHNGFAKPGRECREACRGGDLPLLKQVLGKRHLRINSTDEHGRNVLIWACIMGHTEIVRFLLTIPKVNINKDSRLWTTPLVTACADGRLGVVRLLLEDPRIDVNTAGRHGITPLERACLSSSKGIVEALMMDPRTRPPAYLIGRYPECQPLLDSFCRDPEGTRRLLKEKTAVDTFALIIFLSDGLLRLKE